MVLLGAAMLWFGWFGFNAGSSLAADGIAVNALMTTHLAAASALLVWSLCELVSGSRPSATGLAIGAVVGLVGAHLRRLCRFARSDCYWRSLFCFSIWCDGISKEVPLDDALDVFACHGVGGIVGSLLTGVFASTAVNPAGADGLLAGNPAQMWPQLTSVLAAGLLAAVGTWTILSC